MVQLPEVCTEGTEAAKAGYANICEIGKERIRRAGQKILTEQDGQIGLGEDADKSPLDIGFRVFKLDSSNLKLWDDTPINGENALSELEARLRGMLDIIKLDRTEMDVVYEVMLKLGQELHKPIIPIDLGGGKVVYGVGTGNGAEVKFIVCLVAGITPEDTEAMAEYTPGRIIFANACFENTEQKSNVKLVLRDKGITIKAL
jgi:adenine-specific DNA-methyltransferase